MRLVAITLAAVFAGLVFFGLSQVQAETPKSGEIASTEVLPFQVTPESGTALSGSGQITDVVETPQPTDVGDNDIVSFPTLPAEFMPPDSSVTVEATYTGPPTITYTAKDSDGDSCPDLLEMGDNQAQGGLRDLANQWDYFNPTHDGRNRVDDILKVVMQYGVDVGSSGYNPDTDRTAIVGGDPWDLGPPNGLQRIDDILAIVKQYSHDCSSVQIEVDVQQGCYNQVVESTAIDASFAGGCVIYRNAVGEIDNILFVQLENSGEAASICTTCGPPPANPGTWYTAGATAKWEIKWPLVERVCVPHVGCIGFSLIEVTLLSYKMHCTWKYFDGPSSNPYDGVVDHPDCSDRSYSSIGVYALESQQDVAYTAFPAFEVTARGNGQIGVFSISGVALRHFTVKLFCRMGPWDQAYCWATG